MSDNFSNAFGRAVLNYTIKTTAVNLTLLPQDSFSIYMVTAPSVIITLPSIASVYSGWNATIKNDSNGSVSVDSSDLIEDVSSVTLSPGQFIEVTNIGATFKISRKSAPSLATMTLPIVANTLSEGQTAPASVKINSFVAALSFTTLTGLEFSVSLPQDYNPSTDIELHWCYQSSTTSAGDFDWELLYQFQAIGTSVTATPTTVTLIGDANPATIQLKDVFVTLTGAGVIGTEILNMRLNLTARPVATFAHVISFYLKYQSL